VRKKTLIQNAPTAKSAAKKKVRTFSASDTENLMLEAMAEYHGFSKSATITNLIKKEFWRVFPHGTPKVPLSDNARVKGPHHETE